MGIDWTKLFAHYKGKWVALADDEQTVIASGNTVRQALDHAQELGHDSPILTRVPTKLESYIG